MLRFVILVCLVRLLGALWHGYGDLMFRTEAKDLGCPEWCAVLFWLPTFMVTGVLLLLSMFGLATILAVSLEMALYHACGGIFKVTS